MSQVLVLNRFIPYLRGHLDALGYTEHTDEFDQDNVAKTVIDKTYMLTPGGLTSSRSSHTSYEWTFPVTLTLWFSGYRNPSDAVDGALESIENVLDNVLDIGSRYSQAGIMDIYPSSIDFEPIASSNDCTIQASVGLTATIQMFNEKNCYLRGNINVM
jgi:hypothetical protein